MYYKIQYADGKTRVVCADSALSVIKHYDLATKEHINTRVSQLSGEQAAIAQANFEACDGRHENLAGVFACSSCSMIV